MVLLPDEPCSSPACSIPAFAIPTIWVDVLLCLAAGLLSLLKFVLTLISLDRRSESGVADSDVILVRADCGIDCGGLALLTASAHDRARLVGERPWASLTDTAPQIEKLIHQKSGHLCPPPRVTEDYSYFESKLSRNKSNIAKRERALVGGIDLQF